MRLPLLNNHEPRGHYLDTTQKVARMVAIASRIAIVQRIAQQALGHTAVASGHTSGFVGLAHMELALGQMGTVMGRMGFALGQIGLVVLGHKGLALKEIVRNMLAMWLATLEVAVELLRWHCLAPSEFCCYHQWTHPDMSFDPTH
jgi:hypothetical protein